jgi:hypothetical protein
MLSLRNTQPVPGFRGTFGGGARCLSWAAKVPRLARDPGGGGWNLKEGYVPKKTPPFGGG